MDEGQKLKSEIFEGILRKAKAPEAVIRMLINLEDEVVRLKQRVAKLEEVEDD